MAVRQGGPGLLCPSHLAIQHAEPTVAVGCKGTHAQFLGQGERLLVVGFGLLGLRRLSLRCNLAKEPQGVGFVTPFLMGPGELQGPLRLGAQPRPAGVYGEKEFIRGQTPCLSRVSGIEHCITQLLCQGP